MKWCFEEILTKIYNQMINNWLDIINVIKQWKIILFRKIDIVIKISVYLIFDYMEDIHKKKLYKCC